MSTRAASPSHVPNEDAGDTGGLGRSALLLAAALVVSYRRRPAFAGDDVSGVRDTGFPTLGTPAVCRDALASLLGTVAERIRFGWADATLPVDGQESSAPVLDADELLDSHAVVARNDWRFTVSASADELANWAAQGLVIVTEDRTPVMAPALLVRLREAVPLWHGLVLAFEVEHAPDVLILDHSVLPARDDALASLGLVTGPVRIAPPRLMAAHGPRRFLTRAPRHP